MIALDLLGAGAGLSTQTILVRVKSIDVPKLRAATGDKAWAPALAPALAIVDQFPQAAVDAMLPIAKQKLEAYGITADVSVSNNPPPPRAPAETWAAIAVGTGLGAALAILVRWVYHKRKH